MFSMIADKPAAATFKAIQLLSEASAADDFVSLVQLEEQVKDLAKNVSPDTLDAAILLLQSVKQRQSKTKQANPFQSMLEIYG